MQRLCGCWSWWVEMKHLSAVAAVLIVLLLGMVALVFRVCDVAVPPVQAQSREPTQLSTVELGEGAHHLDIEVELKETWVELDISWSVDHTRMSWCLLSGGERICAVCEAVPALELPEGLMGCYTTPDKGR